jgi:hypothetical protein
MNRGKYERKDSMDGWTSEEIKEKLSSRME